MDTTLAGQKKAKLVMSAIESFDIVGGGSTQTSVATAGERPSKRIKSIHLVSLTLMKLQMDMQNGSSVSKWEESAIMSKQTLLRF